MQAVDEFERMALGPDRDIDLVRGALLIAAEQYPKLDVEAYVRRLDDLGAILRARLRPDIGPTDAIRSLNKKTMRIRGYILPTSVFQQKGIKQFVLVRDNQECCFGPGAMIYDCIIVEMQEGKSADFATRPVTVQGRFEIDSSSYRYSPDGDHYAIFRIKATEVK